MAIFLSRNPLLLNPAHVCFRAAISISLTVLLADSLTKPPIIVPLTESTIIVPFTDPSIFKIDSLQQSIALFDYLLGGDHNVIEPIVDRPIVIIKACPNVSEHTGGGIAVVELSLTADGDDVLGDLVDGPHGFHVCIGDVFVHSMVFEVLLVFSDFLEQVRVRDPVQYIIIPRRVSVFRYGVVIVVIVRIAFDDYTPGLSQSRHQTFNLPVVGDKIFIAFLDLRVNGQLHILDLVHDFRAEIAEVSVHSCFLLLNYFLHVLQIPILIFQQIQ